MPIVLLAQLHLSERTLLDATRQVDYSIKDSTYHQLTSSRNPDSSRAQDYKTSIRALDQVLAQDAGDANLCPIE